MGENYCLDLERHCGARVGANCSISWRQSAAVSARPGTIATAIRSNIRYGGDGLQDHCSV